MIRNLTFFLLTHFSVGLIVTGLVIPPGEIDRRYFRVLTLLAAGLTILALASLPFGAFQSQSLLSQADGAQFFQQWSYAAFSVFVGCLILWNFINSRYHRLVMGLSCFFGAAGVMAFAIGSMDVIPVLLSNMVLTALNGVSAMVVMGSVLGAMITGHWYLTRPDLSLNPILNSSKLFLYSVFLRVMVVVAGLVVYWNVEGRITPSLLVTGFGFEAIIFWTRVVVGLLIPLIFAFMTWSSAKMASTQSATGILYATIILVLVGEVFARFLSVLTGIAL